MKVIRLRCICRALNRRGLSLHAIADAASIGVEELRRLMEFGSMPEGETGERLVSLLVRVSGSASMPHRTKAPDRRLDLYRELAISREERRAIGA